MCSLNLLIFWDELPSSAAQVRRSCWNLVLAWQSSDRPAAPTRSNRCKHRSHWFRSCFDYWLVFTPPTSSYISIHILHILHPDRVKCITKRSSWLSPWVRLRLLRSASSAWLLHFAIFRCVCRASGHIILAFGNRAGR